MKLQINDSTRAFEAKLKHWPTMPDNAQPGPVVGTLDGKPYRFQRTIGVDPVSGKTLCYGWFQIKHQACYFDSNGELVSHGVQVSTVDMK